MMNQTKTVNLTADLQEATDNLALNLLHSEPFLAFTQAKARLDADVQASRLLADLANALAELRTRQTHSNVTQEDVEKPRGLQRTVQANTTIMAFAQAQQSATDYLTEVNQEISSLLGFDFAAFGSPGCCG
jgi:cell fate (sporulation/competence/biofilm development) regulator YlbF (YheA/YmcA/DUF963 family)